MIRNLSDRELEVLRLVASGATGDEIGYALGISLRTVKAHLGKAYAFLEAVNAPHAVAIAFRKGILK